MNTINMPGFTAEAALPESQKAYYTSAVLHTELTLAVLPQAKKNGSPKSEQCKATCYGSYIGGLLGCSFDPYPDICRSIEENKYSRCKSRCGGVFSPGALSPA